MTVQILTEKAWAQERCGKASASEFHKAIATIKSGWGASRRNYAGNLVVERLTGRPSNGYTSMAMQWGNDTEAEATLAYQLEKDVIPQRAPSGHRFWVQHPTIIEAGATPDTLIGEEGIVEIKCPYESSIHLEYYDEGIKKHVYRIQVLFQLLCSPERLWVDLVSYDPRMPTHMQLVCQRIYRDEVTDDLATLEAQAEEFLREVDERVAGYMRQNEK